MESSRLWALRSIVMRSLTIRLFSPSSFSLTAPHVATKCLNKSRMVLFHDITHSTSRRSVSCRIVTHSVVLLRDHSIDSNRFSSLFFFRQKIFTPKEKKAFVLFFFFSLSDGSILVMSNRRRRRRFLLTAGQILNLILFFSIQYS